LSPILDRKLTWYISFHGLGKPLQKEEPRYVALTILDPKPGDERPMLQACAKGDIELAKSILKANPDALEERDEHDLTPLFMAMCFGHAALSEFLLDAGASLTHHDTLGNAAIHHAVALRSPYFVKRLIGMGAKVAEDNLQVDDPKLATAKRNRAISCAMMTGRIDITEILLEHGASLSDEVLTGPSPIWSAVAMDQIELVAWIAERRPEVFKEKSEDTDSLFEMALNWGCPKTVEWMISKGHASWNYVNKWSQHILTIAASRGCYELLTLALTIPELYPSRLEEAVHDFGECTALDAAVTDNRPECLKLLAAHNADIHGPRDEGKLTPIIRAAHYGCLDTLEVLCELGASLTPELSHKTTPLHKAVANNHLNVVEFLVLKKGVNIHELDASGRPAMHVACQMGYLPIAKFLLSQGADISLGVDVELNYLPYTMHLAIYSKNFEMVQWLFEQAPHLAKLKSTIGEGVLVLAFRYASAEVTKWLSTRIDMTNEDRTQMEDQLDQVAEDGDADKILVAKDLGLRLHRLNANGKPPIMLAAAKNRVKCVEILIDSGYELNLVVERAGTLLHAAVEVSAMETIQLILKHIIKQNLTVDTKDSMGWTALGLALMVGNIETSKLLASCGASLKSSADSPYSAVGLTSMSGNVELMKWVLERGIPIRSLDPKIPDAFLLAVRSNRLEMCQYLVKEHSFDVHTIDSDGFSMLYEAVRSAESVQTIEWLFQAGVSIHAMATNGTTPFHKACAEGLIPVVKWLNRHGVSIHAQSQRGTSPLFFACAYGHLDLVKWLISRGSNPFDRNGRLAITAATENDHPAVRDFLTSLRRDGLGPD
jgi:ankyrin repeat protein